MKGREGWDMRCSEGRGNGGIVLRGIAILASMLALLALAGCAAENSGDSGSGGSSGENSTKAAYALYYEKCQEYLGEYGQPEYFDSEHAMGNGYDGVEHMEGLCLAQLVDFDGDGSDELLTAYFGEASDVPDDIVTDKASELEEGKIYVVEVWSAEEGQLQRLYRRQPYAGSEAGIRAVALSEDEGLFDSNVCPVYLISGQGIMGATKLYLYGYKNGTFDVAHELGRSDSVGQGYGYAVDDKALTQEEFYEIEDALFEGDGWLQIAGPGTKGDERVRSVSETLQDLESVL